MLIVFSLQIQDDVHIIQPPRKVQSAQARRACALRALGLLLADGAPTVGGGKTF